MAAVIKKPTEARAEKVIPLRITLVDSDGKTVEPKSLATSAELRFLAEQARNLVRECDRLAQAKDLLDPTKKRGVVPYG